MIYLGADHRGFELKEELKKHLQQKGYGVEDVGAFEYNKDDDYPDFAYAVAVRVAESPEENKGVLVCGSGMGMDVVANKVDGVRASLIVSAEAAKHARENDDINVMTLSGDSLRDEEAKRIVETFLTAKFSGEVRHMRRLEKLRSIESGQYKK